MSKSTNHTSKKYKSAKKDTIQLKKFSEEYYDVFSFKRKPIHPDYLLQVAHELRNWSTQEDSFRIQDFYLAKGIRRKDFYRFVDRHPFLAEARDYAKEMIASRREIGALKNKLNVPMVMRYQALYDQEFKELEEWRASLTKDKHHESGIQVIEIPAIPCKCND